MARRHNRLAGLLSVVGALAGAGMPAMIAAPAAHADFDDLFQPFVDAVNWVETGFSGAPEPGSGSATLDAIFDTLYQDFVYTPLHGLVSWLPNEGQPAGAVAYNPNSATVPDTFTVPIKVNATTEPVVSVSVGGGRSADVLLDTGSAGLVMPLCNINLFGITGLPTGLGMGGYANSLQYVYLQLPTTVTFTAADGDTVTANTSVDAVLFAFPTNFSIFGPWSIGDYLGPANVVGVLGVGPNALGPSVDQMPTADLPGDLGKGMLIDQANHQLIFGDNPLDTYTAVLGAPWAALYVSLDNGPVQQVNAVIDSGGVFGTMPSSVLSASGVTPTSNGYLPNGTTVQVYNSADPATRTLLYEYTVNSAVAATHSPTVTSGSSMNTGNFPFAQQPIYVSNSPSGVGMTLFGGSNAIVP